VIFVNEMAERNYAVDSAQQQTSQAKSAGSDMSANPLPPSHLSRAPSWSTDDGPTVAV
jgi:hypothetical protein